MHKALISIVFSLIVTTGFTQDPVLYVGNLDYIPSIPYDSLEKRLHAIEKEIPLHLNERVKAFIDYYTVKNRDYTRKIISRQSLFFKLFEDQLAEYGLPDELKYLSIIESALNPSARSRAGAVGLWQFMPATGKIYGLRRDWYVDERMDPEKATQAACRYLKELHGIFDDWELALAAYNAGPGNVRRAIRRSGYQKKFWEIYRYLPRETRSYVPQFVAMIYAMEYQEELNLFNADPFYVPLKDTFYVKSQFASLKVISERAGICPEELALLNPEIAKDIIPEHRSNYRLNVPIHIKEYMAVNRSDILDTAAHAAAKRHAEYLARNEVGSTYGREKVTYRVRSGDVLGKIAMNYRVRVADIRAWNGLRSNTIRIGQRLKIWVHPGSFGQIKDDKPSAIANAAAGNTLPPKESTNQESSPSRVSSGNYHLVQPGESLWSISRQYDNLSVEKLKSLNNLQSNKIKPGQRLKVG